MLELDARAAAIADHPEDREALLGQYKPFILKCASDCAKRYISDTDDEWSIALQAFSEALSSYQREQGAFLSFAKLVIRRRLYDYFDAQQKFNREISVAPAVFSGEQEQELCDPIYLEIRKSLVCEEAPTLTEEIAAANALLGGYGFTFFELTACSPKAEKTRQACAKAAVCLLKSPILLGELRRTRQLPMKQVAEMTGLPRKILERHRKYIIAVVELLRGDFPGLAEYLRPIREELRK